MSEETKPVEQQYNYQVDQQVSVNAFFDADIAGETIRFQITNRYGATPEKIVKTVKAEIDAYTLLRQEFPRALVQAPAKAEPKYQPIDGNGNDLPEVKTSVAERLSVEMKDGKFYYKVIAKPWVKFGITVWEETLQAAGLTIDHANPSNLPNIAGWKVDYICKDDGKPHKVTRLLPGSAPF